MPVEVVAEQQELQAASLVFGSAAAPEPGEALASDAPETAELDAAANKAVVDAPVVDKMRVMPQVSGRDHNVYRMWQNRC